MGTPYRRSVRVLVVEDDEAIRSVLERGLAAEGFEVDACADGVTGLDRAIDGGHAVIILDLLLPGLNGYAVCERVRAEGIATPIVILTAKAGEYDQIDLLDAGADDFITKPVSLAVLAARLRVLVRRTAAGQASNEIARGELRYDLAMRTCTVAGASVALSPREDQLLRCLLLAAGATRTRQELLDDVWGANTGIDPTNLDILIRRLREKLAPVSVENVRGHGYRIAER